MNKHTYLKLGILLGLLFIVFLPVYPQLVHTWFNNSNNSHGVLVPFISAYFIWQKREKLREITLGNSKIGLLVLSICLPLYMVSYLGSVAVVCRAMIVFTLIGIILFNLGKRVFLTIAFPLLYLVFMVPVPDSIMGLVSFPLQLFATQVSEKVIGLFSIPVLREGNMLYFSNTQLEVAEACSGIRSIMSYTMLSFLFIYLMRKGLLRKIALLASAIPLALLANITRVTGTGILAHFFDDKVARGFLHESSGLVVFAFGFILLSIEYLLLNKVSGKQ